MNNKQPDWQEIIQKGSPRANDPKLSIDDCKMLWQSLLAIEAKFIIEIGAFRGTSSMILGLAAQRAAGQVWSVEARPRREWFDNIKEMGLERIVTLVKGCSPAVHIDLPGPIDFLFIDGDHQTRSVLRDYYYWSHFVRVGGFIAFHDIYGPPSPKVNRAIEMILNDGSFCLKEIVRCPVSPICGTVIFEKVKL